MTCRPHRFIKTLEATGNSKHIFLQSVIHKIHAFGGITGYLKYRIGNCAAKPQTFSHQPELTGAFVTPEPPSVPLFLLPISQGLNQFVRYSYALPVSLHAEPEPCLPSRPDLGHHPAPPVPPVRFTPASPAGHTENRPDCPCRQPPLLLSLRSKRFSESRVCALPAASSSPACTSGLVSDNLTRYLVLVIF